MSMTEQDFEMMLVNTAQALERLRKALDENPRLADKQAETIWDVQKAGQRFYNKYLDA